MKYAVIRRSLQKVASELTLGLLRRPDGFIDMCTLGLVAAHDSLCCHVLPQLENPGIAQVLFFIQGIHHLADG